jgi:uncharacterized membrane protein YhaH (DUF805 family)
MDLPQMLFSFSGRINRMPYWMVGIGLSVAASAIVFVAAMILPQWLYTIGLAGVCIACLWISLALSVKRAHDRGRSGWFVLVCFVPLLNLWPLVEFYFLRGTYGQNDYGPDPLGG